MRKNPRLVAAVVWTVLLLGVHSIPKAKLEHIPGGEYVHKEGPDKIGHAVMFMVLGVLWCRVVPRRAAAIVVAGIGYGAALEFYQSRLVAGRTGSATDVAADAAGLVIGIGVIVLHRRFFMHKMF